VGLDGMETRRAVDAGWRVLKLAGIEPDGFVAPAYAYTATLRSALSVRFRWWAGLLRVHAAGDLAGTGEALAPALSLTAAGPFSRALSPPLVRAGSLLPTRTLRLDLHPEDLSHPRHMMALEWVLKRTASRRAAVTYQELAGV
jgi:predicted deacetylase